MVSTRAAHLFCYPGGKFYQCAHILDAMPAHDRYIEPFLGSGTVFLAKPRVPYEVINDLDSQVMNFFQALRAQPTELIAQVMATPYSRAEFTLALACDPDLSPLEQARRFFVRQNQGFGGKAHTPGDWGVAHRVSRDQAEQTSRWWTSVSHLAGAVDRLAHAMIECDDAVRVITRYVAGAAPTERTLVYCDPPYVPETRVTTRLYQHEMHLADHERLLECLAATPAMVLLSGYDHPLYQERLAGWQCDRWTTNLNLNGRVGKHKQMPTSQRTECLWRNPAAMAAIRGDGHESSIQRQTRAAR